MSYDIHKLKVSAYIHECVKLCVCVLLMHFLAHIKPVESLLMPLHYEIVQQIINRLSKYLSALKICIFHSFLSGLVFAIALVVVVV